MNSMPYLSSYLVSQFSRSFKARAVLMNTLMMFVTFCRAVDSESSRAKVMNRNLLFAEHKVLERPLTISISGLIADIPPPCVAHRIPSDSLMTVLRIGEFSALISHWVYGRKMQNAWSRIFFEWSSWIVDILQLGIPICSNRTFSSYTMAICRL